MNGWHVQIPKEDEIDKSAFAELIAKAIPSATFNYGMAIDLLCSKITKARKGTAKN
jgi:hypothetical protein